MTFLPGQSGNPGGFPGKRWFAEAIHMELAAAAEGRVDPVPALSPRALIRQQLKAAAEGNLAALQFLAERAEGKPRAVIAGDNESPIQFSIERRGEEARNYIAEQLARISARQLVEAEVLEDSGQQSTCETPKLCSK
jgi:hypothetical protein